MRDTHQLAREQLASTADRRKDDYDLKVKRKSFKRGDWCYYYYPRRYQSRSPKWTKQYTGPYLVIGVIEPNDYIIQRSKRGQTMVVHGDKLKLCHGETPKSWLETDEEPGDSADLSESDAAAAQDTVPVPPSPQSVEQLPFQWRAKAQRPESSREPKVVSVGIGNEVEWDLPEVERTRQKRARQPPADPHAVNAGSGILPSMNSSRVRPTRPRYMNEYYLFAVFDLVTGVCSTPDFRRFCHCVLYYVVQRTINSCTVMASFDRWVRDAKIESIAEVGVSTSMFWFSPCKMVGGILNAIVVSTEDEVCGCRPPTSLRLFYYSTVLFRTASAFQVSGTQRQPYNCRDTETNKGLQHL